MNVCEGWGKIIENVAIRVKKTDQNTTIKKRKRNERLVLKDSRMWGKETCSDVVKIWEIDYYRKKLLGSIWSLMKLERGRIPRMEAIHANVT